MGESIDTSKKKFFDYENFLLMPNSNIKEYLVKIKALLMLYSFLIIPYRYILIDIMIN